MYKDGDKFEVVSGGDCYEWSFDIHTDDNNLKISIPT